MKIVTWKRDRGFTFTVLFANGTSGAEYVEKSFKTLKGAEAAAKKFREVKGENWEHGNLEYNRYIPATGEKIAMFARRNFGG